MDRFSASPRDADRGAKPAPPSTPGLGLPAGQAHDLDFSPENHAVEIPIPPALLLRMGVNAQRGDVETGGIYDDKISTVAVYDRPWRNNVAPGEARLLGMIFISTRTDQVFRIEAYPEAGGSFDIILAHLETLLGLSPGEASIGR